MEFKVGDIVTVKSWAEMQAEFGGNGSSIPCEFNFSEYMSKFCGTQVVIQSIGENGHIYFDRFDAKGYNFSKDMIKLTTPPTPIKLKPGHIEILSMDKNLINTYLDKEYIIKEFHNNQCIMTYKPSLTKSL